MVKSAAGMIPRWKRCGTGIHLTDGIMLEINYEKAIKAIYWAAVAASICEIGPHPVLWHYVFSYEVNVSEWSLPRITGVTLNQIRSDYCKHLKSYQHSIGKTDSALCPLCRTANHTMAHLFDCPSDPTNL
jgi:hypothetical protein